MTKNKLKKVFVRYFTNTNEGRCRVHRHFTEHLSTVLKNNQITKCES